MELKFVTCIQNEMANKKVQVTSGHFL